jgi:hypothetical protein
MGLTGFQDHVAYSSIVKTFTAEDAEDAEKFLKSNTLKSFSTDKPYSKVGAAKARRARSF